MAHAPVFLGVVREGRLDVEEPARWRGYLGRLNGKRVRITVGPASLRRSSNQNAYLWAVVYETIAEWCGHDADELHEVFKAMFLPPRELLVPTGRALTGPGSTAALSIEAFSEYVSKIKRWAAEQGVYIPEANEIEVTA